MAIGTFDLGDSVKAWSLDGHNYRTLPFFNFELQYEILDGQGTGRTQAIGWEMFRQPEGTIFNFSGTVGIKNTNNSENEEFKHLFNTIVGFGTYDFKPVSFITPIGLITQDMYSPSGKLSLGKLERNGVSYWGTFPMVFIAKKAYLT